MSSARRLSKTNCAGMPRKNMSEHLLRVFWFMTVICYTQTSVSSTQGLLWTEDSDFVNLTIRGDVPTVFNVTSASECLRYCLKHDTCNTIFYNPDLQACKVCLWPCAETLVPYPGFRCFRSRKTAICPLPPEVQWASPSHAVGYYGDVLTYSCDPGALQTDAYSGRRTCSSTGDWFLTAGERNPTCTADIAIGDWVRVKATIAMTSHMVEKSLFPGVIGRVAWNLSNPLSIEFPWIDCSGTPNSKYELLPLSHPLLQTTCTSTTKCSAYPNTVCWYGHCFCNRNSIFNDDLEVCL